MKPQSLTPVSIDSIEGLVTNIELQDLSQNFALELDGFRNTKGKTVGQRDFGSRHIYALPPLRPNPVYAIAQIAFASGTATITLTDAVSVELVGTTVPIWIDENLSSGVYSIYNGVWSGTVVSTTSITFSMVNGQGTLTGGILSLAPVQLVQGTAFYDPVRERTFDLVVGQDTSGYYHIYVYDEDPFTLLYRWIDLTATYQTTVDSVSQTEPAQLTPGTITYGGSAWTAPTGFTFDAWRGWYVYDSTSKTLGIIAGVGAASTDLKIFTIASAGGAFTAGDALVISNSRDVAMHLEVGIPSAFYAQETQEKVVILQTAGDGTALPALRVQYRQEMTQGFPEASGNLEATAVEGLTATGNAGTGMPANTYVYRVIPQFAGGIAGDSGMSVRITGTASFASVDLAWTAVASATGYLVVRYRIDETASTSLVYIANETVATNSYTDDNTFSNVPPETPMDFADPGHVWVYVGDPSVPSSAPFQPSNVDAPAGWFLERSSLPANYTAAASVAGDTPNTDYVDQFPATRIVSTATVANEAGQPYLSVQVSAATFNNQTSGATAGKSPSFPNGPPTPETRCNFLAWYATLLYDGYQETDPVCGGQLNCGTVPSIDPDMCFDPVYVAVHLSRAAGSQRIRSVNIYLSAQVIAVAMPITSVVVSPDSYKLAASFTVRQVASEYQANTWPDAQYPITPYYHMMNPGAAALGGLSAYASLAACDDLFYFFVYFSGDQPAALTGTGLDKALARQPLTVDPFGKLQRKLLTPRYAARPSRFQTSLVAVDSDDSTVNLSVVDGYGQMEDENFAQVVRDVSNNQTIFALQSRGKLLGLADQRGILIALKGSEIELMDPYSGSQEVQAADVASPRSICRTEFGIVWAGMYGLYLLPVTGGPIQKINEQWADVFDGTTLSQSSTPYIQDPTAIVTGYSRLYKEAVFSGMCWNDAAATPGYVPTLFRYSFPTQRWAFRRLALTGSALPVPVPTTSQLLYSMVTGYMLVSMSATSPTSSRSALTAAVTVQMSATMP